MEIRLLKVPFVKVRSDDIMILGNKYAESPAKTPESKSFLGILNYYSSNFRNFAEILEPLHRLLKKDIKWKWGKIKIKLFREKSILTVTDLI